MPQKRAQATRNAHSLNPMPPTENQGNDTENASVPTEGSGAKFDNAPAEPNQNDDSTLTRPIVDPPSSESDPHQTAQNLQPDTRDPTNIDKINSEIAKYQKESKYLAALQQLKDRQTHNGNQCMRLNKPPINISQDTQLPIQSSKPSQGSSTVVDMDTTTRHPPPMANMQVFKASEQKELETFLNRLHVHINTYEEYYTPREKAKVNLGVGWLGEDLLNCWSRNARSGTPETWHEFKQFCIKSIKDPRLAQRDAAAVYQHAEQQEHQTVTKFANYLDSLEDQLEQPYTNNQWKMHLYAKLHPEVQHKTQHSEQEPSLYKDYVSWLQSCEDNVPEQQSGIHNAKFIKSRLNKSHGKSIKSASTLQEQKETFHNFFNKCKCSWDNAKSQDRPNQKSVCWRCNKGCHDPDKCMNTFGKQVIKDQQQSKKLDTHVLGAATALGIKATQPDSEHQQKCIAFFIWVGTSNDPRHVWCLLDSRAESGFIQQH